jgi:hypothetical protein
VRERGGQRGEASGGGGGDDDDDDDDDYNTTTTTTTTTTTHTHGRGGPHQSDAPRGGGGQRDSRQGCGAAVTLREKQSHTDCRLLTVVVQQCAHACVARCAKDELIAMPGPAIMKGMRTSFSSAVVVVVVAQEEEETDSHGGDD